MEDTNYTSYNLWIELCKEVQMKLIDHSEYIQVEQEVEHVDYNLFGKLRNTKKKILVEANDPELQKAIDNYTKHVNHVVKSPIKWIDLWTFCQFVRWAEKSIFFVNDKDNELYVDSDIDNVDVRRLVVNATPNVMIQLELKRQVTPVETLEIIVIQVSRNYGKQLKNRYMVVNGEVDYPDGSDRDLMLTINTYLNNAVKTISDNILDCMLHDFRDKLIHSKFHC